MAKGYKTYSDVQWHPLPKRAGRLSNARGMVTKRIACNCPRRLLRPWLIRTARFVVQSKKVLKKRVVWCDTKPTEKALRLAGARLARFVPHLFNMSRTLSIGKTGPGPGFWVRPFLYLNPPAATSACLSDARLCSLISARGASLRSGNPLLRLGLPRSIRQSRVAGGALGARRKRAWGSPQRPRVRTAGWDRIALCRRGLPEG